MSDTQIISNPGKRRAKIFRIAGTLVLVVGLGGAGLVYWLGTRTTDTADDLSMTGFDRSTTQQMGVLYGKQGEVLEDWLNDLKQPGTQAILIMVATGIGFFTCFKFARLWERNDRV